MKMLTTVLGACALIAFLGVAHAGSVLYDDFNDNDISDWDVGYCLYTAAAIAGGGVYPQVLPDAVNGRVVGRGSGYSNPVNTWMTKELSFDASGTFSLECMGRSGSSWPNQVAFYFMTEDYGTSGETYTGSGVLNGEQVGCIAEGYRFMIYGESNRRLVLHRLDNVNGAAVSTELARYEMGADIHNDHTYRVERDQFGDWTIAVGAADGTGMSTLNLGVVNDTTYSKFGHLQVDLIRDQSNLDYISIGATAVPLPASAWLGLGMLSALGVFRRHRRRALAR